MKLEIEKNKLENKKNEIEREKIKLEENKINLENYKKKELLYIETKKYRRKNIVYFI